MSETSFPVSDLLRRRLQTSLAFISLTACVAATLFLLLFSDRLGFGITVAAQNTLTVSFSLVFSQFLLFVAILVFAVGAVIVSIIVFLMMAQRTRDFGLMKAAGCPNSLVFGYFFTELLIITATGCLSGIALGFAVDYAVINSGAFQASQKAPNLWFAPLVFAAFFVFALIFGAKPMLDASRMSPVKALSPVQYFGLSRGTRFRALSKSRLTLSIAARSLFRRQAATVRIVVFLSVVFTLLTVSIAGSIIARDTTGMWVERAVGKDVLLIAHNDMGNQYKVLLEKFSGAQESAEFNYLNPEIAISDDALQQLTLTPEIARVDPRLVWKGHLREIGNFTFDPNTLATIPVGDERELDALVVGVEPEHVTSSWFMQGRMLIDNSSEAVVGDAVARLMFELPLSQSFAMQDMTFNNVGVCLDPINNGLVAYVDINLLENITGFRSPNVVLAELNSSADRAAATSQLQEKVRSINPDLTVLDLNVPLEKNMSFLSSIWFTVLFLPLFCLAAAALCLVSYLLLSIEEQHQEFAVLRAVGAKPRTVVTMLSLQSAVVLLSSFAVGISIGTIITLLILMAEPVVNAFTILEIAGWLLAALAAMFLLSLYPAVKFARKPLLKIMS
jgi:putative ABC transport system permease protein